MCHQVCLLYFPRLLSKIRRNSLFNNHCHLQLRLLGILLHLIRSFLRFDHHCKWLNTCVGAKNYKYFLVSIFSVCVFTSITLGLSIGYTIEVFAFQDDIIKRLDDTGEEHAITVNFLKGLSIISAIIMVSWKHISISLWFLFRHLSLICRFHRSNCTKLPLVALVYQLVGFHFMLIYQGITTYEFIVLEQKRQRDRMEAERSRKTAQKQGIFSSYLLC